MVNFWFGFAVGCFFVTIMRIAGCAADEWENRHGE
jgi:hypothetical protein